MGYMEQSFFAETQEGTPQGGIISPLLANIALHGMEETLGITYKKNYKANDSYIMNPACKFTLIRYADDFVVLTETKEQALSVYMRLRPYLKDRGLELSPEKTKVTHIEEGFEFLGFLIRQYQTEQGNKLFIKPSKGSRQKAKKKIGDTLRVMRGQPIGEIIRVLNPIIRGYGQYWKHVVSKKIFGTMDRMKLARKQGYRCAICKTPLQNGEKVVVKDMPVPQHLILSNLNLKSVHLPCLY